ncbi:MAG TPA: hypothetical protein VIJ02_01305 [Thermoanaerobaculia bacterium]
MAKPDALAIWSSDNGLPSKPLAPLGVSGTFTTSLPNGWQGADLTSDVSVTAGTEYWVVWDPTGGEQASLDADPGDIQQTYCDGCVCYAPEAAISRLACQCNLLDPSCGIGECVGGSYCDGPYCPFGVCHIPSSPISQAMCGGLILGPDCK